MDNKNNMAQKKEESGFIFPQHLLSQLDECSAGGFLLFVVGDQGDIQPYVSFGSELAARALTDYCADFSKSFKEINSAGMTSSLAESFDDDDDEDFHDKEF